MSYYYHYQKKNPVTKNIRANIHHEKSFNEGISIKVSKKYINIIS
jgi:hypothetical protein